MPYILTFSFAYAILEVFGALSAIHAIFSARTSQGATAWALSLVTFPFIALPIYWTFGRNRFDGYVKSRRAGNTAIHHVAEEAGRLAADSGLLVKQDRLLERLARMPFTSHNELELLVNGEATFDAIFAGIERAQHYILIQFFIVKHDKLGQEFKRRLIARRRDGIRVFFMYDEIGSHNLSWTYLAELRQAGVEVTAFNSTRTNRFQINFRNHRKILVIDGEIAMTGGLNVGDEYLGRSKRFGPWRDTHLKITGPGVLAVQVVFIEDWYWATGRVPAINWEPRPSASGEQDLLIIPSGPADRLETCGLFFVHAINRARERLWIASPYFVPDQQVVCALQLAALRGVDVRIMLPQKTDHLLVYLSSFSYLDEVHYAGVRLYRYQEGFLHHKVILVDHQLAGIGTANLDNRSFRLNFELTAVSTDQRFTEQVRAMLEADFKKCKQVSEDAYRKRPFWFRLAVKVSRLLAPLQ